MTPPDWCAAQGPLTPDALLWTCTGRDSRNEPIIDTVPVELEVRWVARRREALRPDGTPVSLDATVVVAQEIPEGSLLWLGRLVDLPAGTTFAASDGELMEVQTAATTPDIRGRVAYREVGVARFRGALPM